jgi:hypothetical protein
MTRQVAVPLAGELRALVAARACGLLVVLGCQAPTGVALPTAPPDHMAVWVATFGEARVEVSLAEAAAFDALVGARALEWAAFPPGITPPLGPQPGPGVPALALGPPRAVLGLTDVGFVTVEPEASVSGRLQLPCSAERLQRVTLPPVVSDTAASLVPLGVDELLLTGNPVLRRDDAGPCLQDCVLAPGAIGLLTPTSFRPLTHPRLAARALRPALACSDGLGGAWLLDGELRLFRVEPSGALEERGAVQAPRGKDIVPSAISCWPSPDDPTEPAIFVRNFDFDVYYVPPGSGPGPRLARLTDTRVRRFGDLRYTDDAGIPIDRMVGVGVDTSIFEATGVDTVRVQFWTPTVYELRVEPKPTDPLRTSTAAAPIPLPVFEPGWVVPRSVRATTSRGWAFIVYQTHPTPTSAAGFPREHLLQVAPTGGGPVLMADVDLDARLLLGFRDLLLGTRSDTARLFLQRPDGTLGLCATVDIGSTPTQANIARGGLAVIGGTDPRAALVGLQLGR